MLGDLAFPLGARSDAPVVPGTDEAIALHEPQVLREFVTQFFVFVTVRNEYFQWLAQGWISHGAKLIEMLLLIYECQHGVSLQRLLLACNNLAHPFDRLDYLLAVTRAERPHRLDGILLTV